MTGTLAFIFNPEQFRHADQPGLVQDVGTTVATADVDVLGMCFRRSIPAIDLTEHLEGNPMDYPEQALGACEFISATLHDVLPEVYRPLAFHMAFDLLCPLAYCLQMQTMASNLLRSFRPEQVLCFGDHREAFILIPRRLPPDLANGVVRWILEQDGTPVRILHGPPPAGAPVYNEPINWNPADGEAVSRFPPVLCLTGGAGIGEQEALWRENLGAGGGRAAPMFPVMWRRALCFRGVEGARECMEWVARTLERLRREESLPPILLHNGYLDCLWTRWAREMQSCLRGFQMGRFVAEVLQPKVVLTGYDIFGHTRCLSEALWQTGITPLSVIHGGIGGIGFARLFHHGATGHVACWSQQDAKVLNHCRASVFQVWPVGSLRTDIHRAVTGMSTERPGPLEAPARPPNILFLTSPVASFVPVLQSPGRHVAAWQGVLEYCARRRDLRFLLKKHPRYDYAELYSTDPGAADGGGFLTLVDSLPEALQQADLVVLVNVITTAALDAICAGLPLVYLNASDRGPAAPWAQESGVDIVASVPELEARIDQLLSDRAQARALVARLQANLKSTIAATGPEAVERLWRFMEQVRPDVWEPRATDAPMVNPVSLWCLRFLQQADQIVLGASGTTDRMQQLRFPADAAAEAACPVDLARMVEPVFAHVLWKLQAEWRIPAGTILRRIHGLLPRRYRLPFSRRRPYLVQALLLDAKDLRRSIWRRRFSAIAAFLLAPGRWGAQGQATDQE